MGVGMHVILMPFKRNTREEEKNIKIFHDHIY